MFDWDDQELANIIWGEGSETDDHIVPYPEDIDKKNLPDHGDCEKKKFPEDDTNSKANEQNTATPESYLDERKEESNNDISAPVAVVDPQPDLPSFAVSKAEENSIAKKTQLDTDPEIPQNQHEDKELGELVGNSWANIGSFDDLDRIFSNDELDGSDELWSSSKNLVSEAAKSSSQALGSTSWDFGPVGNTTNHFEINSDYLHDENRSLVPDSQKADGVLSYSRQKQEGYVADTAGVAKEKNISGITAKTEPDSQAAAWNVATNKPADKDNWAKHQRKHVRRADKLIHAGPVQDIYGRWPSSDASVLQFDGQGAPANAGNYPASQQLHQQSRSMAYQNFSSPYVASYAYGNFTHQYPAMSMLKPTGEEHQSVLSNSESSPGGVISLNKPVKTPGKPVKMTPQEKIEKLRRRQQMRAMLAIQKQQQQLGRQASTFSHKSSDDEALHMEKTDFEADERLGTLPSYDPGSPNKLHDSSAISDIDDCSAEDTVVYQLQDIVGKMDMNTRLCMRDSLYRLAHSATQRTCKRGTSSTHRSSTYETGAGKEEISGSDRSGGTTNVETETNQIDRVVAHLLFHRPFKFSVNNAETPPESSTSTKISTEHETVAALSSLQGGFLTKSSESEYNPSPHGSKAPRPFMDCSGEDILNEIPQREVSINPQMKQKMLERDV